MSEMELLIQSLEQRQRKEAYEQIKTAFSYLAQRNEIGLGLFTKEQEPYQKDQTYRYQHDPMDLLDAFAAMQERSERLLPPPASNFAGIVGTEPFPVTTKAAQILKKLLSHSVLKFFALFKGSKSRSEIVATFLAILELCKLKSISVSDDPSDDAPAVTFLKMPDETAAGQ